MDLTSALGWFASFLAVSMFLPQLVRTYRFGFAGSIGTIALASCSGIAWTAYGVLRHDIVIVVCNTLLASSAIAIFVRWGRERRAASALTVVDPVEAVAGSQQCGGEDRCEERAS